MNDELSSLPRVDIQCPHCGSHYRIPLTDTLLRITCKKCGQIFYNHQNPLSQSQPNKTLKEIVNAIGGLLILAGVIFWFLFNRHPSTENWVTIEYGALINMATLTHTGETVAEIIRKIPKYTDETKGLVQPYLEPFSVLCHDVLLYKNGPDTLPLVNILAHYPVGSPQPAWASISREGHFQIYYSPKLIRVFVKGASPEEAIGQNIGMIRHAIIDIKERYSKSLEKLEVYTFKNDYASMQILLNIIPKVYAIGDFDVSPRGRPIDLASIDEVLSKGIILEAMEVDEKNDLYLYGRKASVQTLAGQPLSLSDIAVVYRSVFHYGNNSPYISLDKNEDIRFAKVNYGGLLENTRVGHVVLEADKLFKTLSTGIDPNTYLPSHSIVCSRISGFLTEDERSLLEQRSIGHSQIRYWFYPDSIGTVTDGSIGAIETSQFLADVERMDIKVSPSIATLNTIAHLNHNFSSYADVNNIYCELNTVGRIMGLINWLKAMNLTERVSLDDFLSVPIPAFETPRVTKKMLAVSTICFPEAEPPTPANVHENTSVFYLSHLLDNRTGITSDEQFMDIASKEISDSENIEPPQYRQLKSLAAEYKQRIESNEATIESLEQDIQSRKASLDQSDDYSIDSYNSAIEHYNSVLASHKIYVNAYNSIIEQLNALAMQTRQMTSIGGGIGMNPKQFKKVSWKSDSPQIKKLRSIKSSLKFTGKIYTVSNWIRNNISHSSSRINLLPSIEIHSLKTVNGKTKFTYTSVVGYSSEVSFSNYNNTWETTSTVNESSSSIHCVPSEKTISVAHPDIGKATARAEPGRRFVFSR
jgi:hypothetical protein